MRLCIIRIRTMALLFMGLVLGQLSQAAPTTPQPAFDSVSIGFIPSKGAHHKGALHVNLEAKTLAHHKSIEIEKFFTALSQLAAEGTTGNATEFHQPTMYIDAVFQGQRVRLFYAGDSKLAKFSRYEKQWKILHGEIFRYLNPHISPETLKNGHGDAVRPSTQ